MIKKGTTVRLNPEIFQNGGKLTSKHGELDYPLFFKDAKWEVITVIDTLVGIGVLATILNLIELEALVGKSIHPPDCLFLRLKDCTMI